MAKNQQQAKKTVATQGSFDDGVLAEIRACRAILATDPREVPVRVQSAHAVRCNTARDAIESLTATVVASTVPRRLVGLFAVGDGAAVAAAAEVVADGGIALDAAALWKRAAAAVEPSLGPERRWGPSQWHLMMTEIVEAARAVGYQDTAPLSLENEVDTADIAELAEYVASLVNAHPDLADLQYRHLRDQVVEQVIERNLVAAVLPVVVYGASPDEVASLRRLFSRAIIRPFESGEVPTRETLTDDFKAATTD